MKRRPRWTPDEVAVLERNLRTRGAAYVAKRLDRTPGQVLDKARRISLPAYDAPPGCVTVREAAFTLGLDRATVDARARREGVLRSVGRRADGKCRVAAVPVKWVDAEQRRLAELRRATTEDWVTLATLSAWTGLTVPALHKYATRGGGLLTALNLTLRTMTAEGNRGQPTIVIHPVDADAFRVALEKLDRRIATLVPLKRLGVELGISRQHMHKVAKHVGVTVESWPRRQRVIAYVTREDAQRIREAYGQEVREAA